MVYRLLEAWRGTVFALMISALLFGVPHIFNDNADWTGVLSATSGGLLLGILYSTSGRLWLVIALHTGWNFSQLFFGVSLSGSDLFGQFFESELAGPVWITGGAFGPESSTITIVLLFLLSGLLFRRAQKQGHIKPWSTARA